MCKVLVNRLGCKTWHGRSRVQAVVVTLALGSSERQFTLSASLNSGVLTNFQEGEGIARGRDLWWNQRGVGGQQAKWSTGSRCWLFGLWARMAKSSPWIIAKVIVNLVDKVWPEQGTCWLLNPITRFPAFLTLFGGLNSVTWETQLTFQGPFQNSDKVEQGYRF